MGPRRSGPDTLYLTHHQTLPSMSVSDMLYLPHHQTGPLMSSPARCTYLITTWATMSTPDTLTNRNTTWVP